jgi:phosphoenolpyruvate carboxylase
MRALRISFIVVALVGLVAVAGCGGSDSTDGSDSSSATLSNEEYGQQAQQILLDFGTSFQQLGTQISSSKTPEQFADLVNQAEDEIQSAIDDFSALNPPSDAQEGHDETLSALENFSSKLTDVSDAADSGDNQALQEAAQALQTAGLDFQKELTQASQSLQDAGIDLSGNSSTSTDSTTG